MARGSRTHADRVASVGLEEKVRLLTGSGYFTLASSDALGLGEVRLSDGPTGVRGVEAGKTACLLPNATLLASTWDPRRLEDVGRLLAEEAQAQRVHVVLGPTINLHRSPLGGRLFEMYSEDPLLTGLLAASYVRGLQAQGVGACLKHLVANESETERTTMSSDVDEATLREVYLLPFEIAIEDANAWTVMAAYNDVNGTPATEHAFTMRRVLREEWQWDGVVMSDWGATKSASPSASAGLGLVMPGPVGPWGPALVQAVQERALDPGIVDEHVERLLTLADRVGELGSSRSWPTDLPSPDSSLRRDQLRRLAASGMVLLTNDGVLPLEAKGRIVLIGRHAEQSVAMGGGSAEVNPPHVITFAAGLRALLGARLTVCDGPEVRTRLAPADPHALRNPRTGEPGMQVTLRDAEGIVLDDRPTLAIKDLYGGAVRWLAFEAEVVADGDLEAGVLGVGDWRITVDGCREDVSLHASGRCFGEEALAPPTFATSLPVRKGSRIFAEVALGSAFTDRDPFGSWGLALRPVPPDDDTLLEQAERNAREADVAIVVVGLTEEQETESVDKTSLALPGRQDELVLRVAAAAERTVVVVNAATPVLMPWAEEVDAILWAGLPGQEAGSALADVLLGQLEPSGRLTTSFPRADRAAPGWSVTPVDGRLPYAEGPFVGYRGFHAGLAPDPLFWFGHGLGYTTWHYGDLLAIDAGTVQLCVTNTGSRAGREVVQLYFEPLDAEQPIRLVGWQLVDLEPHQAATVTVSVDRRAMRRWVGEWVDLGDGEFVVARGLGDERGRVTRPLLSHDPHDAQLQQ